MSNGSRTARAAYVARAADPSLCPLENEIHPKDSFPRDQARVVSRLCAALLAAARRLSDLRFAVHGRNVAEAYRALLIADRDVTEARKAVTASLTACLKRLKRCGADLVGMNPTIYTTRGAPADPLGVLIGIEHLGERVAVRISGPLLRYLRARVSGDEQAVRATRNAIKDLNRCLPRGSRWRLRLFPTTRWPCYRFASNLTETEFAARFANAEEL